MTPPSRVLLVASSGGHLDQLYALETWWRELERDWVTFGTPDALSRLEGESVHTAFHPTTRNVWNLIRNLFVAGRVLRAFRPELIVSTGAGVAVPFFMIARVMGIRTAFIEVTDRLASPTLSGRICARLGAEMFVQRMSQTISYPHARVIGRLL